MTAMVTPFKAVTGEPIDWEAVDRVVDHLMATGSEGLVVRGTTGESPTLTGEEKVRLFHEVREALDGTGSVVAGTGTYSTAESIQMSQEAQEAGVDGLLLVVPYYNKPTQEGLYLHFKTIAESTDLPCILYNVPSRTITSLAAETTIRLSQMPNIVGIKEASADFDQITKIVEGAAQGFKVWSGNDSDTFSIMCLGGYGVVSVASHLAGRQIKAMMQMLLDGSMERASAEHRRLLAMFKGLFVVSNPIPVKYCVNLAGFDVGKPRLPLNEPDEKTASFLRDLVGQYKIDLPVESAA